MSTSECADEVISAGSLPARSPRRLWLEY